VELAAATLQALGIAPQHRAAVRFFIEHHLLLSGAARRRDTSDPGVLGELADVFILSPYPGEYLDLIFIITWADVRAAHPRNLTGYFTLTLARTYERVRERVLAGRPASPEEALAPAAAGTSGRDAFCRDMGERYQASNDPASIRRDYETLAALAPDGFSLAVHTYNEYLKVKFYSNDRPGLFALFCGLLSKNGATIVRADIHTWRGRVLDEFYVTHIFESESGALDGADDVKRWESAVRRDGESFRDDLDGLAAGLASLKRLTRGLGAHFKHPARVTVTPREGSRALIEVSGRDRPALLFDLAVILAREGVEVQSALIDTSGWLVDDRFEVRLKDETRAVRDRVAAALAGGM
jgi:[protein-PII] uridylyltransferase